VHRRGAEVRFWGVCGRALAGSGAPEGGRFRGQAGPCMNSLVRLGSELGTGERLGDAHHVSAARTFAVLRYENKPENEVNVPELPPSKSTCARLSAAVGAIMYSTRELRICGKIPRTSRLRSND
jgi:hypothetical protein